MISPKPNLSNQPRAKIGVALSGGGIRGLAFLGVLQVLEEYEIPVGMMAGTSAGGLVVGLYAAGVPLNELTAFSLEAKVTDFACPDRQRHGLFGHAKMAKLLADLLGDPDITFEDLQMTAAVTATDVQTGELVILDRGPLIPALVATSALPILFSPVWRLPLLVGTASMAATSRIINQTRLKIAPPDLLLDIELPNVGLLASDNNAAIVETGRQVAMQHIEKLIELETNPLPPHWQRRLASAMRRLGRAWEVLRAPEHILFPGGTVFPASSKWTS